MGVAAGVMPPLALMVVSSWVMALSCALISASSGSWSSMIGGGLGFGVEIDNGCYD